MRIAIAIALAITSYAATRAAAQTPVRDRPSLAVVGTATITGTVVADDDRRTPLRRVLVTLSRAGTEDIRRSGTDDAGRFVFGELPAGTYTLSASKGGYVTRNVGALQPGMPGSAITVVSGARFSAPPIALPRGGVIAGRLIDRNGRPMARVNVLATQLVVVNGEQRHRGATGTSGAGTTNAHGEYRIFGLLPGEYFVYATPTWPPNVRDLTAAEFTWVQQPTGPMPSPGRALSYAATTFPGTTDAAGAASISLAKGEERTGVDFQLQHVPAAQISGVVTDPTGRPASGIVVWRTSRRLSLLVPSGSTLARTASDGSFVLTDTPPGDFILIARGGQPPGPGSAAAPVAPVASPSRGAWGTADLRVSGQDITDVAIRLQPGMSVSGRVTFRSGMPPVDFARLGIRLLPVDPSNATSAQSVVVGPDGLFSFMGVMPGAYRFAATIPGDFGAFARSAMHAGTDIIDVPVTVRPNEDVTDVVVTLSNQPSELSGTLVDASGQPTPQFYVFVYPTDRTAWTQGARRIASVRADVNGRYVITGLPPGEYLLCALTEFETALQYDPTYLEQSVPASIKITLGEGEKRVQDLRVGGGMW